MVVPQFLDIEQSVLLLELEPPFDKRAVQLARRRMAKRWHPDIAPPGRQHEHERHLKAINEAADQLERLAEDSRGGKVSRNAVKVSAAGRAQGARRGGPARVRGRAARARARRRPREARPVRLARARPLGRAPLRALPLVSGVGRRQRQRHLLHGRRRRHPAVGARLVPGRRPHGAGRLAAVRRLLEARPGRRARRALHDRRQARAGRGRLRAGGAAARLRARRRAGEPGGAAAARDGLLAGGQPRRRRPRRPRLGARGARPARAAPHRRAHLRGPGRALDGDRLRRSARPSGRRPTAARSSGSAACGCARSTARARVRRTSRRARSSRASRGCSTSRWSAT